MKKIMRRLRRAIDWRVRRLFRRTLTQRYPNHQFGRATYGGLKVHSWGEGAHLEVGAYTSFAADVQVFLGGEHRLDWVTTYPFSALWKSARMFSGHPRTKGDVRIGSDVWIGTEAVIFSGVCIGDGAVVGARSVVTKDVPPYAIVAGNPAKLIRYRFSTEQIDALLSVRWWDWSTEEIELAMPRLLNDNIDDFLAEYGCGDPVETQR